jgi:hypothetical protein
MMIFLSGCSTSFLTPTVKSNVKVDQNVLEQKYRLMNHRATASLSNHYIAYLPVSVSLGNNEDAVDALSNILLRKYRGDLLTDVVVKNKIFISFYWNIFTYEIEAEVWRKKDAL